MAKAWTIALVDADVMKLAAEELLKRGDEPPPN